MHANESSILDENDRRDDPKSQPLLTSTTATTEIHDAPADLRSNGPRQRQLDQNDDHPPRSHPHQEPGDQRPMGRGLERAKSRSWRKLADYVATGEVLLTGPTLIDRQHHRSNMMTMPSRTMTDDSLNNNNLDDVFTRRQIDKDAAIRMKRWHFQRMMSFSLTQVMLALLLHVAVAIVAFSFLFHNWTVIDSVYFAVVTFTTIGYGDLLPLTHAARFFTCVYALSGVTCLGIAIGVVSSNIAEARDKAVREAKERDKIRAFALFRTDSMAKMSSGGEATPSRQSSFGGTLGATCGAGATVGSGCHDDDAAMGLCSRLVDWVAELPRPTGAAKVLVGFLVVLLVLGVFGAVISRDPAIGAAEIVYFLMITATTLGFGDVAPTSQPGRLATAIFIPIAVGTMGHWLAIVAKYIVEQRQQVFRQTFVAEGISLADLQAMDTDDDGNVSRAEFLEFMLLAMNKVDKSLLEELRSHFDRLDADKSGVLSKDDLIAIARRQLKKPSRKLELARYKKKLRMQADQARRKEVSWFNPRRFSSSLSDMIFPTSPSAENHDPSHPRGVAPSTSNMFRNDAADSLDICRTSSVLESHGIGLSTAIPAREAGLAPETPASAPPIEGRELV